MPAPRRRPDDPRPTGQGPHPGDQDPRLVGPDPRVAAARQGRPGFTRRPERPAPRRGRPPAYSLEQILEATVELLDEAGESAFTFRALAARLGCGVGSIYWYVGGKDELLDRATDIVLAGVLARTEDLPDDPYEALRALSDVFYDQMQAHPWVAAFLMRDTEMQPSSMGLYERFGRQLQKVDLTSRQRFHAASALMSYVVGVGAEMREPPAEVVEGGMTQAEALREYANLWRALDPQEYPFVHEVADEFETHHDVDQFRAGVDLILAGIRAQAG